MKEGIWTRIEQKFTQNSQGLIWIIPYACEAFPDKKDFFWEIFTKNDGFAEIKDRSQFIKIASIFDQSEQKEYLVSRLVDNPKQICSPGLSLHISDIKELSESFTEQVFLNQLFDLAVTSIGVEKERDVGHLAYLGKKSYRGFGFSNYSNTTKSSLLSNVKLDVLFNIIKAIPEKFFKRPNRSPFLKDWKEDLPFKQPQIQQLEEMARQFSERTPGANYV